jgi:hypothetical protein
MNDGLKSEVQHPITGKENSRKPVRYIDDVNLNNA